LILSAKHGFLNPHAKIAPYDERMTPKRAEQMLANLPAYLRQTAWPSRIGKVMLAGGQQYRRVMRAALVRRYGEVPPLIRETEGGIGMQRSPARCVPGRAGVSFQRSVRATPQRHAALSPVCVDVRRSERTDRQRRGGGDHSWPPEDFRAMGQRKGPAPSHDAGGGMTDFERTLRQEAKVLFQPFHGTPGALIALTHAGFRAWAKGGNLQFPDEKRYALLHEVMRYCADECLLACCLSQERRLREIAEMLDASYPDTRARLGPAQSAWLPSLPTPPLVGYIRLSEAAGVCGNAISVYNSMYG